MTNSSEAKATMAEQPEDKKPDKKHRRQQDDSLVRDLRELYSSVLEEPIPQDILEIVRRKKPKQVDG